MSSTEARNELMVTNGDVAIIGMAAIFPGAPDVATLWQNIVSKVDAITDVPADRWETDIFFDPDSTENDRVYCKRGGYLGELAEFNPLDFGIMPVAVDGGDPGQFLALKVAYQALADAGYVERPLNRERVEIILGRGNYLDRGNSNVTQHSRVIEQTLDILKNLHPEYSRQELHSIKNELKASLPHFGAENAPSLIPNITTGRIANRLDLMGPNYTIDAACASSLIATELGMNDLLARKCDLALVGGIFILPDVGFSMVFSQLKALSQQSQIRPFDKNADGTIIGEGVGILALKRLEDAERDDDRIYAVIKGAGTSSDGRALSVTAPRVEGPELALKRAYQASGISPCTIGLIEAHGTGTPAGDAAEIEALTRVFGKSGEYSPWCAMGTVKSMIGHAMPAAGSAGLIKAALALYHKVLPPTLHCDQPLPQFEGTPFYINSETRPWIHGNPDTPRRAGVNAFGFGGINAHVVMEEYRKEERTGTSSYLLNWETEVCIVQADSRDSLMEKTKGLEQFLLTTPVSLKDLAYTLNTGQEELPYRLTVVTASPDDLLQKLRYALKRLDDPKCRQIKDINGIYFFEEPLSRNGKLAFLFPGEAAQYTGMLADLCIHFPEVRNCFDKADAAFIDHQRGYLPSNVIFPPPTFFSEKRLEAEQRIWQMDGAIEAVTTANEALLALLKNLKLQPDAIVGHSTGEFSAMFASGMAETDLQRIHQMNSIYEGLGDEGIPEANMVAVGANYDLVADIVDKIDGNIYVAMDNCPHQVVVVGEQHATELAIEEFRRKGLIYEKLPFNRAYHTPLFEVVCQRFRQFFSEQSVLPSKVETWSCATAQPYPQDEARIQELLADNWMRPVRFNETIAAMYAAGVRIFVEVGPRGNLTSFVDDILHSKPHLAVASNVLRRSGITQLNHLVGMLAAQGVPLNLDYLYKRRMPQRLSLQISSEDDAESASGSMVLPLGFPPMSISPHLPRGKTTETTGVPSEAALQQDKNSISEPEDIYKQELADELPSLSLPEVAGAGSQGNTIVARGKDGSLASKAMEDYLATTEHFLDVQRQVMHAYLTNGRAITAGEQRAAAQPPVVEIARQTAPVELPTPPMAEDESQQSTEIAGTDSRSITEIILNLVSDRTGYPPEMLDLDLNMEADLGIDSIKRIEILGAFQEQYPPLQEDVEVEQVSSLKTLRQIIDFFSEKYGEDGTLPAAPGTPTDDEPPRGDQGSPASGELTRSVSSPAGVETRSFPFIDSIISHTPGSELTVQCLVDLEEDIFLQDHTLGSEVSISDESLRPQCVIPMTASVEMIAETAARLVPDKLVIGIKDVQAHRWIPVGDEPTTLRITARKHTSVTGEEVAVRIRVITDEADSEPASDSAVVEGTVLLADTYSQPPVIEAFSCRSERLPKYTARELYQEKLMFHGPRFQGVVSLDKSGEDGIIGQLEVLPNGDLFRSNPSPLFIIDPFLLDAAGQLVGYWPLEYLETGFIAFPIRLQGLHLYGPMPHPGQRLECRVRINEVTPQQVRADVDIIGEDNRIMMRLIGWEDWRFNWTAELFNFWRFPRSTALSTPWDDPIVGFPVPESFLCYRLNTLRSDQIVSKDLWVNLILNRRERETWHNIPGPESRRTKWLMGRWVAKDAVRMFLKRQYGKELYPADIEITTDEYGNPLPCGLWTDDIEDVPVVSLAHTDGLSVALAGFHPGNQRIGIDIEQIRQRKPGFDRLAFVPEEQSLLYSLDESSREEWVTRLWCAKEAVAKALGRGLIDGPQSLAVRELHPHTGVVEVVLRGKLAELFPEFAGNRIIAHTVRDSNYVVATSICERSQND